MKIYKEKNKKGNKKGTLPFCFCENQTRYKPGKCLLKNELYQKRIADITTSEA